MCLCDHLYWIYEKDAIINIFGNMILKYSIQYNYVAKTNGAACMHSSTNLYLIKVI